MSEIIPVETINPATATAPAVRVFRMNQKKNNAGYPIPQPKLSLPKKCCRIIHKNLVSGAEFLESLI
uniref:Uncharacterized protein n=1 Tax=Caenorhabditis japonica TaxID=281687 RepID=A0A8R1IP74_CAEJA